MGFDYGKSWPNWIRVEQVVAHKVMERHTGLLGHLTLKTFCTMLLLCNKLKAMSKSFCL